MSTYHIPVLMDQTLDALQLRPGRVIIDGTVGGGGHAQAILQRILPGGTLIGFDRDRDAIDHAEAGWKQSFAPDQCVLIHDSTAEILQYAERLQEYPAIHGAMLDLGISSHHLEGSQRGFSFQQSEEPLDMRMDTRTERTAAHLLNTVSEADLTTLLREYGEEPNARRIARAVVEQRNAQPLATVQDLVECVAKGYRGKSKPKSHMATRTFQALRIAVNRELEQLPDMLRAVMSLLSPGARLAVITFHSLEDRIVKHTFKDMVTDCICPPEFPECRCDHPAIAKLITKKPIPPTPHEVEVNPRARSAKLRCLEKL